MNTKHLSCMLILQILFLFAFAFVGCNKDEEGFSKEEIRQALHKMKGTYNGTVYIIHYQSEISKENTLINLVNNAVI